jgi:hypothetical protein
MDPLGFTQNDHFGRGHIASGCEGVEQIPIRPDLVGLAAEARPPESPRFWTSRAAEWAGHGEQVQALRGAILSHPLNQQANHYFYGSGNVPESVPTAGHGAFDQPNRKPVVLFPYSHIPTGKSLPDEYARGISPSFVVDLRPEMRGFLSCFHGLPSSVVRKFYPGLSVTLSWKTSDGTIISDQRDSLIGPTAPQHFFEETTYYYVWAEAI